MTDRAGLKIPTVVQKGPEPMFRGLGPAKLSCGCGHVLIDGYQPRQYSGIGFECFSCGALTLSELWPSSEPLPQAVVTLGLSGRYLISTVDVTGKAGFTSDQEIERIGQATGVRPRSDAPFELSLEGLELFRQEMNDLSGGEMDKAIRSVERANERGNKKFLKSPLAWAIYHMKASLEAEVIDLNDESTLAALTFVQFTKHLMDRWRHHPLFYMIPSAFIFEYSHVLTQLIAATYLSEHGNPIGFNDHKNFKGKSPDLFINANAFETISLEVKAPGELQWPNPCPGVNGMEALLEKHLRNASKQLVGELGGLVIIGASWASRQGVEVLEQALRNLDKRHKISSRIAGVVGVCLNTSGQYQFSLGKPPTSSIAAHTFVHLNSRFTGEQFIRT